MSNVFHLIATLDAATVAIFHYAAWLIVCIVYAVGSVAHIILG